jgi:Domain of Unknown Function (DUF1080)
MNPIAFDASENIMKKSKSISQKLNLTVALAVALSVTTVAVEAGTAPCMDKKGATLLLMKSEPKLEAKPVVVAAPAPKKVKAAAAEGQELPPPKDEPKVIDAGPPPSDAIVLFDGTDLSKWANDKGGPAKWDIKDGVMTVTKTGYIHTKQAFGDCQLHAEWATPAEVKGDGQGRGNSGIFLQGHYEIQVLDSYNNKTYFHGQAGSLYKQHAPLVNASRKPGEWQVYDIIFHAPKFSADGKVEVPGNVTVLGTTSHSGAPKYEAHGAKEPLSLQDHGNPVRYRNIWIREL